MNDELILMDEFPRVSMSQASKWAYLQEYLKAIYEVEEIPPEPEEELEEILEDIEEVWEEDPELAESIFKDLLEIIEKEDEALFESLVPMPASGEIKEVEDEIFAKNLGAWADIQKWYFTLDDPRVFKSEDYQELVTYIENRLVPVMKNIFDQRAEGEDLFLLRITYDRRMSQRKFKNTAIGVRRAEVKNWEQFRLLILDPLYEKLSKKYKNYLSANFKKSMRITGFSLENLYLIE